VRRNPNLWAAPRAMCRKQGRRGLGASAARSGWLAEAGRSARGSLQHDLALREASRAPAGRGLTPLTFHAIAEPPCFPHAGSMQTVSRPIGMRSARPSASRRSLAADGTQRGGQTAPSSRHRLVLPSWSWWCRFRERWRPRLTRRVCALHLVFRMLQKLVFCLK